MRHIKKLRYENKVFIDILKNNNYFEKCYKIFISHAIFTISSLKHFIKSKRDIQQMVERYNKHNHKNIDLNDSSLIECVCTILYVWLFSFLILFNKYSLLWS